jgi:hypothetical protein
VRFKINVPDEDRDILVPLTIEGKLADLKTEYERVI